MLRDVKTKKIVNKVANIICCSD